MSTFKTAREQFEKIAVGEPDVDTENTSFVSNTALKNPPGYPGMKCSIVKFECNDPNDMAEMAKYIQLENSQEAFFSLRPLPITNTCHYHQNVDDAVYIASNDDAEVVCGSMAIRFYHKNRSVEVNLFATQRERNPNIKGVGTNIMNRLIADCNLSGVSYIFLWPLTGAVTFYEQFGFRFFNTSNRKVNEYMYLPVMEEPAVSSMNELKPIGK